MKHALAYVNRIRSIFGSQPLEALPVPTDGRSTPIEFALHEIDEHCVTTSRVLYFLGKDCPMPESVCQELNHWRRRNDG